VVETVRKCVHEVRADGAQVVIALTHLPFSHKETFTNQLLVCKVPGIYLLLDGHEHSFMVRSIHVETVLFDSIPVCATLCSHYWLPLASLIQDSFGALAVVPRCKC
jgi:hypothetical protein